MPEQVIKLEDLENEIYRLDFLVKKDASVLTKEEKLSVDAGNLIGDIYKHLLTLYKNPDDPKVASDINKLCVRLAFCLFAEDADLFSEHSAFYKYLSDTPAEKLNTVLQQLFNVLDTKYEDRSVNLSEKLNAFPYVNGNLFKDPIEIPELDEKFKELLLNKASLGFNWKDISPTIFGAIFESTMNPDTRRSGGMHYTSQENIHKVIDPLFLRDLKAEFQRIKSLKRDGTIINRLREFQKKLGQLKFLDPACGSGNFLTETFLCLRKLENDIMREIYGGQQALQIEGFEHPIYVTLDQFYGIEINDFAVSVAQTALWIADLQMKKETELIIKKNLDYLPLVSYNNIHCANALRIDWNDVVPASKLSYIMGNPPFIGARMMPQGSTQKQEIEDLFGNIQDVQDLDYVCCWYKKAAEFMQMTSIQTGFVATNSICQGAQVPILWNVLLNNFDIKINYAYQSFKWINEAIEKAAVYCVIIGFGTHEKKEKLLYCSDGQVVKTNSISPYLIVGDSTFVISRKTPLSVIPQMNLGNQPRDGGHFILNDAERNEILKKEPDLSKWILPYIGATEFINRKSRWCFWLKKAKPHDIASSKTLHEIVEKVRKFRTESSAKTTQGYAKVPSIFAQITQIEDQDWLLVPRVSTSNRVYIPIGFMAANVISSDAVQIVPNANLYHFGILTSIAHMAWMRVVAGRLGMGC